MITSGSLSTLEVLFIVFAWLAMFVTVACIAGFIAWFRDRLWQRNLGLRGVAEDV